MTALYIFIHPYLLMAGNGLPVWAFVVVMAGVLLAAYIYTRLTARKVRAKKAAVELQLAEKSELLQYAVLNEHKAKEEVSVISNSKKELLSKISHEIRTPMNAMWGMISLLNQTELGSEQREYTAALLQSGEGMLTIINDILLNDILQYSKIESGKELESKHFDLRSTIEEVLEAFGGRAAQANLELLYNIDKNVPPQIVGDMMRLRQILMNMVENAFRFTSHGEIYIGVQVAEYNINGLKLEFEVRDTGTGMDYEKLKEVSMDLIQPATGAGNGHSIGLTLTICKKLVNLMGGYIEVESQKGIGTSFRFTIITGKSKGQIQVQKLPEIKTLSGNSALIVVSNTLNNSLLKQLLERWDMHVQTTGNGEEALKIIAASKKFDIIITDYYMAGMNGVELATEVKNLFPKLPIILLQKTGEDNRQHSHLFYSFINKPMRQHAFITEISAALLKEHHHANEAILTTDFAEKNPLSILIAEDDAMNQQMIKMVLKKLGYESTIAANGKEVLEIVSQRRYDLILMDVQMPEMDGLEATRMIRMCLEQQPIIVAMTANTLQGDREECLESGMDDYISKPVNLPALVSILQKWAIDTQTKNQERMRA